MRNNTRIKPLPELSKAHNSLPSLLHADKSSWVLCYTSLPCSRGSQTPRSNQLSAVQTVQQVDLSKNDRKTQGLGAMIDMKEQKTIYSCWMIHTFRKYAPSTVPTAPKA